MATETKAPRPVAAPGKGVNEASVITDPERVKEVLARRVVEVIERESLEKKLLSGKRLRIKLGIDPTGSKIHLGRAIPLRKLHEFQELGHQIVLIIGDFTATIGDPSDKDETRKMLSREEVAANMAEYIRQIGLVLDLERTEFRYNSEWLSKMNFADVARLAMNFTVQQMIQRDRFQKRIQENKPLGLQEFLYPLMQGYDSVAIRADVELGGTDQTFNLLAGRTLQKAFDQVPQDIMTTQMLDGTDGRKMSTSWGNVVNLTDRPEDMYGKLMSTTDELVLSYFRLCTDVSETEIADMERKVKSGDLHPMDFKKRMAYEITVLYHDVESAKRGAQQFESVVQKKELPDEIQEVSLGASPNPQGWTVIDLLACSKLASSKSDARRLIQQGGITINGERVQEADVVIQVKDGDILAKGKRNYVRLRFE